MTLPKFSCYKMKNIVSGIRMNLKTVTVRTEQPQQMIDITQTVRMVVRESGVTRGICRIYIPHTTAAVTINENTDPNVKQDLLNILETLIPSKGKYLHTEGNAHAHAKASLVGSSLFVFVESGQLVLGTWQSVYLCEFDGPRTRNVLFRVTPE
ncbi:MAG: secondary thiamine-phosphate synthase enzyme YjbQ [Deltaproteobacteria bacterium]